MSVTLVKKLTEHPLCVHCDGTYAYVGTNRGRILRVTVADGTTAVYATLAGKKVTAITSDDTYLYVGDNRGKITRITIHGTYASRTKTVQGFLPTAIVDIHHNTSTRYFVTANGKLYTV